MKKMIRATVTALAIAAAGLVAGCGPAAPPLSYAPAAYGELGSCYYVDSPAEVVALQAAGLCPSAWAPVLMPLYWHARYASYYDSDRYYGAYVPAPRRSVYVTNVTVFERSHRSDIDHQQASGSYRGSDGKSYTGAQARAGRNGGGARTSGGGGGSRSSSGTARSSGGESRRSSSSRTSTRSGGGGGRR